MRGISYSPVPTGEDLGYALPYGDYFTSQYEPLFARDLALMAEMGANTVRVYTWSTSARHGTFLDMAHHLGLAVVAVFEMGTAEQTPLVEPRDLAYAQTRLQAKVRATGGHPAVVSWLIGNELNGAWNAFVCDKEYEEETLQAPGAHSGLAHCVRLATTRGRSSARSTRSATSSPPRGCCARRRSPASSCPTGTTGPRTIVRSRRIRSMTGTR